MARKKRRRTRSQQPEPAARPTPEASKPAPSRGAGPWIAGTVATTLLLVSAWFFWPAGGGPAPVRRAPGTSVLLITIDTLRADAVGAYGNATADTPRLDRLAAEGVLFEDAAAHNVVTLPSHANILSGRYPFEHGIRDNSGFRFPEEIPTLATLLKERGYRTGAFVSAFAVDSRFGLDRGFEIYEDSFANVDRQDPFLMQERRGGETVALAREWLATVGDEPFFMWLHLYDPHFPYAPPAPFDTRFPGEPYHGEVAATDAFLAPLVDPFLDGSDPRETLVVVTADHGESLGEHGELTHGIFAYEGTVRVPLILHAPHLLAPRTVSGSLARHVDLLPTILDALGEPLPDELLGRSLLAAANGHPLPDDPSYFEALTGMLNRGWAPLHGVRRGDVKLIELPIPELYDLAEDAEERRNLIATQAARAAELQSSLDALRQADRGVERSEETEDTRRRLEALGYISSTSAPVKAEYTEDDDPKRLIDLDTMLQTVVGLQARGAIREALAQARELVARRPTMMASLKKLAFLERAVGDIDAAVDTLLRAFAISPEDTDTQALLGAYLNEAGRPAETVEVLESFVERERPDEDVATAYGIALAQLRRYDESLAVFARVREIDPSNAMVLVNMATVDLMRGDDAAAAARLREAIAVNPTLARAHNSLGVIAMRGGRGDEAIEHWKRAVELDPEEFDTLFNLGTLLLRQGSVAEARPYLERFVATAPPALYARDIERLRAVLSGS